MIDRTVGGVELKPGGESIKAVDRSLFETLKESRNSPLRFSSLSHLSLPLISWDLGIVDSRSLAISFFLSIPSQFRLITPGLSPPFPNWYPQVEPRVVQRILQYLGYR